MITHQHNGMLQTHGVTATQSFVPALAHIGMAWHGTQACSCALISAGNASGHLYMNLFNTFEVPVDASLSFQLAFPSTMLPDMQAMSSATEDMLSKVWTAGEARDVYADYNDLTLDITTNALFGVDMNSSQAAGISGELLSSPTVSWFPLSMLLFGPCVT